MKATLSADNDEYEYDITFTDDQLDNRNFVEMIVQQKGEDYFEAWTLPVQDLYDIVSVFERRRKLERGY